MDSRGNPVSQRLVAAPGDRVKTVISEPLHSGGAMKQISTSELHQRALAGLEWLRLAHSQSVDGGIPKAYDVLRRRWAPSYPETSGYTVPTLLNAAAILDQEDLISFGLEVAEYLLRAVTPEGAVRHWGGRDHRPIVFDTGQVIFGWLAAYGVTRDDRFLRAALRAGEWLISAQDPSGAWYQFQYLDVAKAIDTRVAWALLELDRWSPSAELRKAAERSLAWSMSLQEEDGWFQQASFVVGKEPYTHTLAYAAEGLLEAGLRLQEDRWVEAARRTADSARQALRQDGWLAGTHGRGWTPTSRWSCLTGNCQLSLLWLRFHGLTRDPAYLEAAQRSTAWVLASQSLDSANPARRGALPGSRPMLGAYERLKYPNWSTKFLLDLLLRWIALEEGRTVLWHVG